MKIEHIAMYVNDLEAARDFFIKYLDGRSEERSESYRLCPHCLFTWEQRSC